MDKLIEAILVVVILIAIGGVFAVLGAWIFMVCWNLAIATAFGAPVLTFMQSLAITVLLGFVGGTFKAFIKNA
jgi:hypothetical protein